MSSMLYTSKKIKEKVKEKDEESVEGRTHVLYGKKIDNIFPHEYR